MRSNLASRAMLAVNLAALCAVSQAANIYVSPSGNDSNSGTSFNQPLQTIAAAVSQANNRDTILLENGYYSGPGNTDVTVTNTTLTIKSINGPAQVTIDCGGSSSSPHGAFLFSGVGSQNVTTVLQGLTIQGAYRSAGGGAISSTNGFLSIQNCNFSNNQSADWNNSGGAIGSFGGGITVDHCTFLGNTAYNSGGGIYTDGSTVVTATYCVFSQNSARNGSGMQSDGTATLSGCQFLQNGGSGSALALNGTSKLNLCTFNGNTPTGLYASAAMIVHGCAFTNNGGGITLGNANAIVEYSYFNGNAVSGSGAAVNATYAWPHTGSTTLNNCLFLGNYSTGGGGAVCANGQTMLIQFCSFYNNSDSGQNGGGAVYVPGGTCTITDSVLWGDQASAVPTNREIATSGSGSVTVSYSDVATKIKGSGNISADPKYFNAGNGDLHPMAGSPCYGVGTAISGITLDYQYGLRRNPPTMGAYESASQWGFVADVTGADGKDHVLYANSSGQALLGQVVNGVFSSKALPANGMTAKYLAVGPTGTVYILWTHSLDNNVTVTSTTTTNVTTTKLIVAPVGGQISDFTVSGDQALHLSWQKDSGAMVLQKITSGGVSTLVNLGPQ